jgi:MYXO-CTERM domain-containing protein
MCVNVDGPPRGDRAACRTGFECRAGACKAVVALTGGGCGCAASGEAGSMLLVAGSLIALLRRRRRVLVSAGQESR